MKVPAPGRHSSGLRSGRPSTACKARIAKRSRLLTAKWLQEQAQRPCTAKIGDHPVTRGMPDLASEAAQNLKVCTSLNAFPETLVLLKGVTGATVILPFRRFTRFHASVDGGCHRNAIHASQSGLHADSTPLKPSGMCRITSWQHPKQAPPSAWCGQLMGGTHPQSPSCMWRGLTPHRSLTRRVYKQRTPQLHMILALPRRPRSVTPSPCPALS